MPGRKSSQKAGEGNRAESNVKAEEQPSAEKVTPKKKKAKAAPKRATKKAGAKRKPRGGRSSKRPSARPSRPRRRRYSDADRKRILGVARREGLTAAQVQKRFGVRPITYYSWTKKQRASRRPALRRVRAAVGPDIVAEIRREVRARIGEILKGVLRSEVADALSALGNARRRRR